MRFILTLSQITRFLTARFAPVTLGALVCAAVGAALLTPSAAHAQVTFSLTPANVTYIPSASSQEVFFFGTITNLGNSQVYLNGLDLVTNGTVPSAFAGFDTDPFYNNTPLFLTTGGTTGSSYSGVLFGVNLGATSYSPLTLPIFGTATLQGGPTDSSSNTLGTPQQFVVSAGAPEPGSLALASCGLLSAAGSAVTRRRHASSAKTT